MSEPRLVGLIPLIGVAVPVLGALASLYLMTNTAYNDVRILQAKVSVLELDVRDQQLKIRAVCSALVETETQFRSADQTRNIMHANDLRIQSILLKKVFGMDYPISNAYYPTIAQDRPAPCG